MSDPKLFMVVLRQPTSKSDERSDPFWEFGSFGCTTCHNHNLLNPRNAERLGGGRLAFAQGGDDGFKLVFITSPVNVVVHTHLVSQNQCLECKWKPSDMPFTYNQAPVLIDRNGNTDFLSVKVAISKVDRESWLQRFSSRYRSRCQPLDRAISAEIQKIWQGCKNEAPLSAIATHYEQALPNEPKPVGRDRRRIYADELKERRGTDTSSRCCRKSC